MCGIAGYIGRTRPGLLDEMIDAISNRGPDGKGRFTNGPVHLGHTRLAIIDLDSGAQPMSLDDELVISFNGEIYNFIELRAEIEKAGLSFSTKSDTEVILQGYKAFGEHFFERLLGMFAFALADFGRKRICLVRDHFGIKPLFYAHTKDGLIFSSSATAVALHPDVDRSLSTDAVRDYLQFRYVPTGEHFFAGVKTLPPATTLTCNLDGGTSLSAYWLPKTRAASAKSSIDDWIERATELIDDAVRLQLRADVPVAMFLSGGVDSSAIATFAARHAKQQMTAYTYSMQGTHDEVDDAKVIVDSSHARHHVVRHRGEHGLDGLYKAIACMDLPVGDAIIVPTYRLCESAAQHHKVVLTGEGADEIFGGYVHFGALTKLARLGSTLPFLNKLAGVIDMIPVWVLNRFFSYQASLGRQGRTKLKRMVRALDEPSTVHRLAGSVIDDIDISRASHLGPPSRAADAEISLDLASLIQDALVTWLPYQILNKMDQLSMAHGLEARVPFLDPRIHDALLHVPEDFLITNRENKILLRRVVEQAGGPNFNKPKFAFHVPVEKDYRDVLRRICDEWLSRSQCRQHGILQSGFVEENLRALQHGEFLASKRLVTMVGLHMWLEANKA
ncbi:MAG: asparagine synthase (glutamine-hydrolyzing) [Gammaproteobacteria bacterium]